MKHTRSRLTSRYEISKIVLQEVDDRLREAVVRWHPGAIPHAYRDTNGLLYDRTGQNTPEGLMIYRTTEFSPPPRQLLAQFEYGPAASRQPDTFVPDPPPTTYRLNEVTYQFFGWADSQYQIPIYRFP